MREKKFKKIVQENPFLLDDIYKISRTDAQAIYQQNFPSTREIIEKAKLKRPNISNEAWQVYDDALAKQEQQLTILEAKQTKPNSFLRRHRRLAFACAVLVLLIGFFTLIPAGKALAAEIAQFFVEVFGGRIEITVTDKPQDAIENIDDFVYLEVSSHAELGNVGIEPFVLDIDGLQVGLIWYEADDSGKKIGTYYHSNDDELKLVIQQKWDMTADSWIVANTEQYEVLSLNDGRIVYYHYDSGDGSMNGHIIGNNELILIGTRDTDVFDAVLDILSK